MQIPTLFERFPFPIYSPIPDIPITGASYDSRKVQPGELFVAVSGGSTDGHRYIPEAVRRGAAAVVGTQELEGLAVPYIRVDNSLQALAYLAAAWYGYPAHQMTMIGVTGTDGKTTTTNLIYSILKTAGVRAGMISTVSALIGDRELDTGFHVTTPDSPDVQRYLAEMVSSGLTHCVLETTSHGWAQYRVDACEFDLGVVTNITHEHLDYHGSFEAYRSAKGRLFAGLGEGLLKLSNPPRGAVLNRDDISYDYLRSLTRVPVVDYSLQGSTSLRAEDIRSLPDGIHFVAVGEGLRIPVQTRLAGLFNVSNCLAALSATVSILGIDSQAAREGIAALPGIPGRMERIDLGQDFTAIVDFAHTPNALRRALETARSLTSGRVIAVFGSAGLRDREKRRMMAETSARSADLTILTAEDPRTESLDWILAEMAAGAQSQGGVEGETFWRIPDRREAIRFAVSLARPGDLVIACGKGHEQSMCFGDVEYSWDDRIAMRAALAERLGVAGPQMPYLPEG